MSAIVVGLLVAVIVLVWIIWYAYHDIDPDG